jgi:MerR family transcriptional regulator, light-induced transcriptional regulator
VSWRIKTVSQRTGVKTETLRAWERRYGIVRPTRSDAGYRLYSDAEISAIARVKELVDSGLAVAEAVDQARREGLVADDATHGSSAPEGGALKAALNALRGAMLDLDRPRADAIVASQLPMSHERVLRELLLPSVREISARRARGSADLVQERYAASWVRERIGAMLVQVGGGPPDGPEALCAGAPGESGDLGLLGSTLYLALRGWRVTYLGGDLEPDDLAGVLQRRQPPLLVVSLLRRRSEDQRRALLGRLRAVAPPTTRVVAAGPGARGDGSPVRGVDVARSFDELPSPAGRSAR